MCGRGWTKTQTAQDGADDRGDEDGDDRTDVTEGVSFVLGARANGFPLPPSVSGSRLSRPR